jgi:transcriptional regulator with XRE-family HTH domain
MNDVAERLGISKQAVSHWEIGRSKPKIERLSELAELFGVAVEELLDSRAEAEPSIDHLAQIRAQLRQLAADQSELSARLSILEARRK